MSFPTIPIPSSPSSPSRYATHPSTSFSSPSPLSNTSHPSTAATQNNTIRALRMLDLLDYHLFLNPPLTDTTPLHTVPGFIERDAVLGKWYYELAETQRTTKMTVVELRGALMRDFGVDAEMRERVEERYRKGMGRRSSGGSGGGGGSSGGEGKRRERGGEAGKGYFEGLAWKVVLSYLDEIEGLKEQLKFRNRKAVEDRKELDAIDARWRRRWEKEEQQHLQQLKEKSHRIHSLETKVAELDMAVKGLTVMLCERPSPPPLAPPPVKLTMTKAEVEDAVEAFMKQMEAAKGKLVERLVLGKAEADVDVTGGHDGDADKGIYRHDEYQPLERIHSPSLQQSPPRPRVLDNHRGGVSWSPSASTARSHFSHTATGNTSTPSRPLSESTGSLSEVESSAWPSNASTSSAGESMIAGFHTYNRAQDVAGRNGRGFAGYGSRAVLAVVNVRDEAGGGEQAEHGNTKGTGAHETRIVKPPEDAENVNQQAMLGSGGTSRE